MIDKGKDMETLRNRVMIIAEAGVNHNGDINLAKKLVDAAVMAGADAVKFQTFQADKLVCKKAPKAEYQVTNTGEAENQMEMLQKLQLSENEFIELKHYCDEKGILFLSTPFDVDSFHFLQSIGITMVKIPSGEITNYPLLREIGKSGLKVLLSTGMSQIDEVVTAIDTLKEFGTKEIVVLQCNTEYPTPLSDANVRCMLTLGKETGCSFGYSDHTCGNEVLIAAVALGATVVEKHFTLDKTMEGPDHIASIEPEELKQLVTSIRNVEMALGEGEKKVSTSERKNIHVVRKSIVARKAIRKGEIFTEENLTTKRPGDGLSPMRWNEVLGQAATKDYEVDEKILF